MKIIIVGAGRIGANLAKSLSDENNEIYLIEKDEDVARKIDEKLDVKVVCGSGSDPKILKQAGIDQADLVIAVTMSDEINMVVCSLAELYGAKKQIARIRNSSISSELNKEDYKFLHIDEIINPDVVSAQAIAKAIEAPGASEVGDFASGRILLRAFDVPETSPLCGLRIDEFRVDGFPWPFLIVAIRRDRAALIPKGDAEIKVGDRIYVLLPDASLGEFLYFIDPGIRKVNKVVIYGATNTSVEVAKALKEKVSDIIILEEDYQKAEDIAERLDDVQVIHGSASEKDVLTECGIEATDAFIATSDNDHSNLVSAVLAKRMGATTTIITTQQPDYMSIVDMLDIDTIINPHLLAAEMILTLIRGRGLGTVTKLLQCDAEALEFIPEEKSPITKGPIKDINLPEQVLIGAVCKDKVVSLVQGNTCIHAGEKVIVFCKSKMIKQAQALFIKKKLF